MSVTRAALDKLIESRLDVESEIKHFYKDDKLITHCGHQFMQQGELLQAMLAQLQLAWDAFKKASQHSEKGSFVFQLEVEQELLELELTKGLFEKLFIHVRNAAVLTPVGTQYRKIEEPTPPIIGIPTSWSQFSEMHRLLYIQQTSLANLLMQARRFEPSRYTHAFLGCTVEPPTPETPEESKSASPEP